MAKLVVVTQGLAGLSHEVTDLTVTIGRADKNTFQIVESSVSGRHCEVRLKGDELAVRDLDSTNGTFADGKKITEAVLKPGQILRVGEVDLRFESSVVAQPSKVSFVNTMLLKAGSLGSALAAAVRTQVSSPPVKRYQVLLVDDSRKFLDPFGELCSTLANQTWKIHYATSADQALTILQQCPIDLAVLDIGMPLVNGLQLLEIIGRRYPDVKLAAMTGTATESSRAVGLANGAELIVEKPASPEDTRIVFNMLNDLVSWPHQDGFSGTLRQVGLQEVIQMECTGRRSLILEIRNPQMRGQIYIEAGAITHAEAGDLVGDKAINRLLSLAGGQFQLKPFKAPLQRTVQEHWETLLMEAARCCDEGSAFTAKPATTGSPEPSPAGTAPPQVDKEPAKKQHVLFVDDSREFLEVFGELCSVMANQTWEIHTATSADRALVILQQFPIDLAVLDIGMPLVDGLQLLGIISRRYPGVRLAVMTGLATESNRATGLANGAELIIEKPIASEDTKAAFNMLKDLVSWPHREGFSGTLRQVGLQEVIQMECTGRRSVILEIRNPQTRGQIYIEVGAIVHAQAGDLVGTMAINRLLSLAGGEFRLKPFKAPPQRTVEGCWEMLLMEAACCCDEDTAIIDNEPPPKATMTDVLDQSPSAKNEVDEAPPEDDFVVVATYDGQWSPATAPEK